MTPKHPSYKLKVLTMIILSSIASTVRAAEPESLDGTKNVVTPVTVSEPTPSSGTVIEPAKDPQKVKVSLTEADGYGAVLGGIAYNNSGFQMGFTVEGGYRPFKKFPLLGVGGNFSYNKFGTSQLMVFEAQAEYALEDENSGPVIRLGLGYGTTARFSGLAVSPAISYYVPVWNNFTAGAQVAYDSIFSSRYLSTVNVLVGIRYWF